ncbi:MAG TPA: fasciclin domain-containing protein [Acidimicrobiales bacterium]
MTSNLLRRGTAIASVSLALTLGLAACGGNDESDATGSTSNDATETMAADDAGAQAFGPGCKLIPAEGDGSFNGMATAPVATAASANPLLTTLVSAVGVAGLGDTLNSADALTVFAPTDDAFAKIDKKTLDGLLADKPMLTKVLTHHVVAGQLSPDEVAGEHETLAGDTITVEGSDEDFTVGDAQVLCGNIPTANATVYVIDTVLVP